MTNGTTNDAETSSSSSPSMRRNAHSEAATALNFWQAIEYLAPQEQPAPRVNDCVWEFGTDAEDKNLPWNDPHKQSVLRAKLKPSWRFQVLSGIISGSDLIAAARGYLAAPTVDLSERNAPRPVACIVLDVDATGMATGQVFVSALPWAMACLERGAQVDEPLEFGGFFGVGGLEENIRARVTDLLIERRLIRIASALDAADGRPDDGDRSPMEELKSEATATLESSGEAEAASGISCRVPRALEPKEDADTASLRQLTAADVQAVSTLVFQLSGWAPAKQESWRVTGKRSFKPGEQTQDDPLNSFYAEDLQRVSQAWAKGDAGIGLQAYLAGEDCTARVDVETESAALFDGLEPNRLPAGCWPSSFPLVTAQQFAVNTALHELASRGLFSVNGPPGTGKTTLLKDLVAGIVVQRADALFKHGSPERAFGEQLHIESRPYKLHKLDASLCGFGIVVASANNNAVENITKELPVHGAVERTLGIDYFAMVADSVAATEGAVQREDVCWGLIAAALGKKANRSQFVSRFWFEKPTGSTDHPDPARLRSLQTVIANGEAGSLTWPEARDRYNTARRKVEKLRADCERTRSTAWELRQSVVAEARLRAECTQSELEQAQLESAADAARALTAEAAARLSQVLAAYAALSSLNAAARQLETRNRAVAEAESGWPVGGLAAAEAAHVAAEKVLQEVKEDLQLHAQKKPGFWVELFRLESSKRWNSRDAELEQHLRTARTGEKLAAATVAEIAALERRIRALEDLREAAQLSVRELQHNAERAGVTPDDTENSLIAARLRQEDLLATQRALHAAAAAELETSSRRTHDLRAQLERTRARCALLSSKLDSANLSQDDRQIFQPWQLERDVMHKLSLFQTRSLFEARRDLFVAALDLHKAFITTAWRRLLPLLRAFIDLLTGALSPHQVRGGVMPLWDAFFLVVPVVSSTFAAFPRQFAGLGREALAWLLIDEAGQASPQQAAGAIWRAKRTVIVGDPLQLEPICQVPKEILAPLLERCRAEQQWHPTMTSAQTLADRANRYGTWFGDTSGDDRLWVGCPLLVHRRCINPMFTIANRIAYGNKMVYGASSSADLDAMPSRWIHVRADSSDGHWVEAQAQKALELVHELTGGELRDREGFKVYVISPFKAVGNRMKELLDECYGSVSQGMAGTVHTFQGKEANHVIFLLGGDPKKPGTISFFAGAKPNLANVAVTRARRRLYVIGDLKFWTGMSADIHGIYRCVAEALSESASDQQVTQVG